MKNYIKAAIGGTGAAIEKKLTKKVKPTFGQNKKTKKSVGIIQLVAEHYTEINLF